MLEHQTELERLICKLPVDLQKEYVEQSEVDVYPFNKHELTISLLLANGLLDIKEYFNLRKKYLEANKFLHVFQISAPTDFGEKWAEQHIKQIVPSLIKPSKNIQKEYDGEYDFLLNEKIRIEVKASRATDSKKKGPLYSKALSLNSDKKFDMNFQQIKVNCCDVFVWVGVWKDGIKYWVLNSREVSQNKYFSDKQHRGNVGEGQLHIKSDNIENFIPYEVESFDLEERIKKAYSQL